MNPDQPIYIVSKGRWASRLTSNALEVLGTPYRIIVEDHEYQNYAAVIHPSKILVLDKAYQRDYDTCDALGDQKSKGPGPARNFAWDHAVSRGASWHWVMDDNIVAFIRLWKNQKIPVADGTIFRCMEDFAARYQNLALAGPAYDYFTPRKTRVPPVVFNTRIYSCNLIRNDIPYRWRGRYNEDTDLSLRALKDGWCTVQFNAFLQGKIPTQEMAGGCSDDFYFKEGTLAKSKMQVKLHPDVSRLVFKYGRWHHFVDYRPFKGNKLILRPGVDPAKLPEHDEYGSAIVKLDEPLAIRRRPLYSQPLDEDENLSDRAGPQPKGRPKPGAARAARAKDRRAGGPERRRVSARVLPPESSR